LARELARVLPNAEYVPRGVKSVKKLSSLAISHGHNIVMIIDSIAEQPKFLRFLEVDDGWKWLDIQIELSDVELQKDLGQKTRLLDAKIAAESSEAKKLANLLEKLWGLEQVKKAAGTGAFMFVGEGKIEFRASLAATIGPVLHISRVVGEYGKGKEG
jgi:rRNA maturation protein Rpf1